MEIKDELKKALETIRKEEKKKFVQTADLIVNLQKFDLKRNQINTFIQLPHKIKDKKICAFLESKSSFVDTITKEEFKRYSDKKESKRVSKQYDFFISQASLMPLVATNFGRVLGPLGKMPSPQLGILANPDEKSIKEVIERINKSVKLRTKESSVKIPIGKESMTDDQIIDNVLVVYNTLVKDLPRAKENIKNVEIKFTMTKPVKIAIR